MLTIDDKIPKLKENNIYRWKGKKGNLLHTKRKKGIQIEDGGSKTKIDEVDFP